MSHIDGLWDCCANPLRYRLTPRETDRTQGKMWWTQHASWHDWSIAKYFGFVLYESSCIWSYGKKLLLNIFHLHNSEEQLVCGCVQYIKITASDYYHHHYSGVYTANNAQQQTVSGGQVISDNINWILSFSFQIKFVVLQNNYCVYTF
jgi:hypothetical protein